MRNKASSVAADLKSKIDAGVLLHGSRLSSTYQIAKNYGIAYPTAHKAIQHLAKEGYVYRKQGEGTFVSKNNSPKTKQAGIIMRTEGHIFGEMAHHLLMNLQEAGYHSQIIPLGDLRTGLALSPRSAIERLTNANPSVIIAEVQDDKEYFALMRRAQSCGIKIIWILCSEPPAAMGGNAVGMDMFTGYYKIAEHLVELGHRKIAAFAIHRLFAPVDPFSRALEQIKTDYPHLEFIPLQAEGNYDVEDPDVLDRIKSMLQSSDPPSAFLCSLDYRAKIVMDAARQIGLRVPEDLSVTGFFDTPWSESYDITTIEIHPDKIAHGIVDMLEKFKLEETLDSQTSCRVLITPTLIVRGSTGRIDE